MTIRTMDAVDEHGRIVRPSRKRFADAPRPLQ
jgi:hypothetical protein